MCATSFGLLRSFHFHAEIFLLFTEFSVGILVTQNYEIYRIIY